MIMVQDQSNNRTRKARRHNESLTTAIPVNNPVHSPPVLHFIRGPRFRCKSRKTSSITDKGTNQDANHES